MVEELARERAKKLFGCEYVNVQPHSGAQANMAVQFAVLKPGDTIMGMNLDHGGHLTHGSPVNFSGTYFHVVPYGVNDEGFIDYDKVREIALECKPKMIIAGASAYARTIDFKKFREIADEVRRSTYGRYGTYCRTGGGRTYIQAQSHMRMLLRQQHTRHSADRRGGMILCNEEVNEKYNFNKAIFPGITGWPADACDRSQGCLLRGSIKAGVQGISGTDRGQCTGTVQGICMKPRYQDRFRWNRQSSDAGGPDTLRT